MKFLFFSITLAYLLACNVKASHSTDLDSTSYFYPSISEKDSLEILDFIKNNTDNSSPSQSLGAVSNGELINGKLIPFFGPNYTYFDKDSYLGHRAFTNEMVREIILKTYEQLQIDVPNRHFYLMELSNQHGGKMFPHKTHQNGLSADFMMPKLKDNKPYYGLDTLGKDHYWLDFNDKGEYTEDPSITIDFNLIAQHILELNKASNGLGYKIAKVIIKIEYKDDLYDTAFGKELLKHDIYVVKSLSPVINNLHDDHFHIDFQKL